MMKGIRGARTVLQRDAEGKGEIKRLSVKKGHEKDVEKGFIMM